MRLAAVTAASAAIATAATVVPAAGAAVKASAASGSTTLKLVVADYGTGPANTSAKYWKGIADAFHKQYPSITVKIHGHPLDQLRQSGPDDGSEPQLPGHHRG